MLSELYELHQVSQGRIALEVSHLTVVIVEFVHRPPVVLTSSNTNDNDAERKLATFHKQIFNLLFVVDDTVSHDHQHHVLLCFSHHALAHSHGLPQQGSEVGGA